MSSLIRWKPVYRMRPWRPVAPHWDSRVAMPLDIEEHEDNFVIKASVPGFLPEDIKIQVEDGILTIRAEHHGDEEQEREGWYLRERFTGEVERQLRLGKNINGENIEAELEHGVLTLTLPKVEEAKPKLIEVKVA
jgi:HSP20 family protein